ncbi:MAG: 6,7-dimethyl-8-ribityllumazine synthase [Bdellovibrionaceae bacterium]|nr:6,7-dimethyl-8-ribityllumazine synthase [Pseudobdellovibrionaceae bacterium]
MGFKVSDIKKIGVVTSTYNEPVIRELQSGALNQLESLGFVDAQIKNIEVPGAYEIPLAAQWLLQSGCEAVLCLGAVIRGETTHYVYVCNAVERGCSELQLKNNVPVVFGVLTTENKEQAFDRLGGKKGHKGKDCAQTLYDMMCLKKSIL